MDYFSEYNNPSALFEKNNKYTSIIAVIIDVKISDPASENIVMNIPSINTEIIINTIVVRITFVAPILFISSNAPFISSAYAKSPVCASLHSAIDSANANMIANRMNIKKIIQ